MFAIDLGSSVARVAWLDERREPVVARAPADIGDAEGAVPAAVWPRPRDEFLIGEAALEGALTHPDEVVLSVRSLLLDPRSDPVTGLSRRHPPDALVGGLLAGLVSMAREVRGDADQANGPQPRVTLSLPPSGGERALRLAAEGVGLSVIHAVSEPVAAALHYGAIRDGARTSVIVFDQGHATLDVTLINNEADRTVRIVHTESHPLGGAALDEAIVDVLRPRLPSDAEVSPLALTRAAEALRLALTGSDDDTARVPLRGTGHEVSLTREQLERAVGPVTERACEAARAVLARADDLLEAPPSTLLLAGGTAVTPGTDTMLAERLGMFVRAEIPESAVVRGLALWQDVGALRVLTRAPARPAVTDPEPRAPRRSSAPSTDPKPRVAASAAGSPKRDGHPNEPRSLARSPRRSGHEGNRQAESGRRPPQPDPPEPDPPEPEPRAPRRDGTSAPAPEGPDLVPMPVTGLDAVRRGDHLLIVWVWPTGSLSAQVRWRLRDGGSQGRPGEGEASCSRRTYEHDGGFELDAGPSAVTLTVEALVPGRAGETYDRPASLHVQARAPIIRYEPSLRCTLRGRVARVSLLAEASCRLPALIVVHGTGRFQPLNPGQGRVVHEIPPQRIEPGPPVVVEFPLRAVRGDNWLVCFPAGPTDADIDLRPSALHRLRVS